jgi:hypothetical protein
VLDRVASVATQMPQLHFNDHTTTTAKKGSVNVLIIQLI